MLRKSDKQERLDALDGFQSYLAECKTAIADEKHPFHDRSISFTDQLKDFCEKFAKEWDSGSKSGESG